MKNNKSTILFVIILILFVFQQFIQIYFPFFSLFDEIFSLMCIPISIIYILSNIRNIRASRNSIKIVIMLILLIVIGLFSSFYYRFQPLKIVMCDLLVFLKFFLMYFFSRIYLSENRINKVFVKKVISIIVIIFCFLTIVDFRYNIYNHSFYKGIMENQLFFGHATYLVAACVFLIITNLLFGSKYFSKTNILLLILIFSSLKAKAIGFIGVYILLYFLIYKKKEMLNVTKLMFLFFICIFLVYDKISTYYFINDGYARQELTEKSIQVAKDYFPIGTGFGTFGSFYSSVNYSPIYYKYNLNNVYGLHPLNPMFIADTFWPMIIAQFGFIGFFIYGYIIYLIYKNIRCEFKRKNIIIYLSKLLGLIYLLISSTSESAFVNPMAIPIAMIIGVSTKEGENNYDKI